MAHELPPKEIVVRVRAYTGGAVVERRFSGIERFDAMRGYLIITHNSTGERITTFVPWRDLVWVDEIHDQ